MRRTDWSQRKVIREGTWSRVYEAEDGAQVNVSKFVTDNIEIDVDSVKSQWSSWKEPERIAFSHAFGSKPTFSREDERILDFLMDYGNERVCVSIAPALPKHSQKERVRKFLTDRLHRGTEPKANFIHALAVLGDSEAIPALRSIHSRLSAEISEAGSAAEEWSIFDFVSCCAALMKLENSPQYAEEIRAFLDHPSRAIRNFSKVWLEGGPPVR